MSRDLRKVHAPARGPARRARPVAGAARLGAARRAGAGAAAARGARGRATRAAGRAGRAGPRDGGVRGPQQSRSIVAFDDVIAAAGERLGPRALPARGREILAQAYEYRGRAYFNIGLSEKALGELPPARPAEAGLRAVEGPGLAQGRGAVHQRQARAGRLPDAVSSRPAGARVTLVASGGARSDLGLTDFFPLEVLAGEYTVEIARPGYQTETRPVSIAARRQRVARGRPGARAGEPASSSPSRRASRSGWTASCAPRPAAASRPSFAEVARARGLDPGTGLGAHRDRRTSRWAATRSSCGASATRR